MDSTKVLHEGDLVVEAREVHKWFGKLHVLQGVTFFVHKRETAVICGPSGTGKSTFLRTLNGLEPIQQGEIYVAGHPVRQNRHMLRELRKDVGIVFQDYNLFPHMDVLQNITLALRKVKQLSTRKSQEIAYQLLERLQLSDKAKAYPSSLSGGQRQRVAIARALALNPKLMLFDEPTSALDPELIGEVLDLMIQVAREGMTMVVVTHELGFAQQVASTVAFFDKGKIIEQGDPYKIINAPDNERTKRFMRLIGVK